MSPVNRSWQLELADVGDVNDGGAFLVGGGEVDRGGDAPVVVAGRVVEDLADRPGGLALLDEQPRRAARVGPGAELVVELEVAVKRVPPGGGGPAVAPVEVAEVVVAAQGGQRDPAEERVADEDPERARVPGDSLGLRPDRQGVGAGVVGVAEL